MTCPLEHRVLAESSGPSLTVLIFRASCGAVTLTGLGGRARHLQRGLGCGA